MIDFANKGYREEAISEGALTLRLNDKEFDIIYIDALGAMTSAKPGGAAIIPTYAGEDFIQLIVSYEAAPSVEVYAFDMISGEVAYTQSRLTESISKAAVMRAPCQIVNWVAGD